MVKVKIKTNKKRIYEAGPFSNTTVNRNVTKKTDKAIQNEINSIWKKIINRKSLDLRKLYSQGTMESEGYKIPWAKMNVPIKVKVTDAATGSVYEDTIIPAEVAAVADLTKVSAMANSKLGPILGRFPKPIIWSFNVKTAASDGVRIAFNPAFAQQLIGQGQTELKAAKAKGNLPVSDTKDLPLYAGKYFLFVLVHEAYHQLYRHREQEAMKKECENGRNHKLANIAQDAEINRDIEKQLASFFAGTTEKTGGIFDARYKMEPWQEIFDDYFYNNVQPPKAEQNAIGNSSQSQPSDSGSEQGDSSENGTSSDNSGESDSRDENTSSNNDNQQGNKQNTTQNKGQNSDEETDDDSYDGDYGDYDDTDYDDADEDALENMEKDLTDLTGKSDEYRDAYKDELQKELDKMTGKSNNQNDNQNDKLDKDGSDPMNMGGSDEMEDNDSDDNIDDDQQTSTGGNGESDMSTDTDDGMPSNSNSQPTGNDDNATDPNNSMSGSDDGNDMSGSDDMSNSGNSSMSGNGEQGQMSKEEREAREQARQDIKKAIDNLKQQIEEKMQQEPSEEELAKSMEGTTIDTETSSIFGGADCLTQEQMAELAREAGNPYTPDELTCDVNELNKKYNKDNMEKLQKVSNELANKLTNISDKLKAMPSLADWRAALKKHFTAAMEAETEFKRSKKTLSQTWRADRANPYKEVPFVENNAANIFYLIDNSGSMYINGNGIFYQIFKEIVTIEKRCKVLRSARAYFTTGFISEKDVEMWDIKTPIEKRLELLGERGSSGGTDIPGNTIAVTKLKKPYYYSKGERHTTIMVFTDGLDYGWERLRAIPFKILKDVVFVLFNPSTKDILNTFKEMMKVGIPLKNLIGIDTSKFRALS